MSTCSKDQKYDRKAFKNNKTNKYVKKNLREIYDKISLYFFSSNSRSLYLQANLCMPQPQSWFGGLGAVSAFHSDQQGPGSNLKTGCKGGDRSFFAATVNDDLFKHWSQHKKENIWFYQIPQRPERPRPENGVQRGEHRSFLLMTSV